MDDRRRSERIKCCFDCEILGAGRRTSGTVVDVSSGGLAVRTEGDVAQGESLTVRMTIPGRGRIEIEALVWHVRRGRLRESGKPILLLGMMLSKAPDEFHALVPERPAEKFAVIEDEAPTRPASFAAGVEMAPHRVRLKHRSASRTRVVTVDATSVREACAIAAGELGAEWGVVEALSEKSR